MRIITDPVRVELIARTQICWGTLEKVLEERGLEWKHKDASYPIVANNRTYSVAGTPGALLADNLTPQKARILLILALTKTESV